MLFKKTHESVHKDKSMSVSRFRKTFILGAILFLGLALLLARFTAFEPRWRGLRDGMTQPEVRHALGAPSGIGTSGCIGAGGRPVIRWDYRRSRPGGSVHYYVDFDYIGTAGAPVAYRTERFWEGWEWPQWFPWQPPRARA
jgi:hypothetical protein